MPHATPPSNTIQYYPSSIVAQGTAMPAVALAVHVMAHPEASFAVAERAVHSS